MNTTRVKLKSQLESYLKIDTAFAYEVMIEMRDMTASFVTAVRHCVNSHATAVSNRVNSHATAVSNRVNSQDARLYANQMTLVANKMALLAHKTVKEVGVATAPFATAVVNGLTNILSPEGARRKVKKTTMDGLKFIADTGYNTYEKIRTSLLSAENNAAPEFIRLVPSNGIALTPIERALEKHGLTGEFVVENATNYHRANVCPILRDLIVDPVLAADGHLYNRAEIQSWFSLGRHTSPKTGVPLWDLTLLPCLYAQGIIIDVIEATAKNRSNAKIDYVTRAFNNFRRQQPNLAQVATHAGVAMLSAGVTAWSMSNKMQ